jgi:hypothetical protein
VLGLAAVTAFAATCTIKNVRLTTIDGHKVYGAEIENGTGGNFLQHRFIIAFIDSGGNVLETKTVEGCVRSLQAGESNWYSVASTHSASSVSVALSRMAIDSTLKGGVVEDGDIVISDLRIRRIEDSLKITGTIKNEDNDELEDPKVCAVVKDEDGNILVVASDTGIDDLDENDTDTFTITVTVLADVDDVAEVDIHADGLEGDIPVAPFEDLGNTVTVCPDATNTPTATTTASPTATNTPDPTATATSVPPTASPTPCF